MSVNNKQTIKFEIDIEDMSPKDASMLCEYIGDFLTKNHNVVGYSFNITDGK